MKVRVRECAWSETHSGPLCLLCGAGDAAASELRGAQEDTLKYRSSSAGWGRGGGYSTARTRARAYTTHCAKSTRQGLSWLLQKQPFLIGQQQRGGRRKMRPYWRIYAPPGTAIGRTAYNVYWHENGFITMWDFYGLTGKMVLCVGIFRRQICTSLGFHVIIQYLLLSCSKFRLPVY